MEQGFADQIGKTLIVLGVVLVAAGALFVAAPRVGPFRFGHLPGDWAYHGKRITFYFPLGTSLLLSAALTLLLWIISLIFRR